MTQGRVALLTDSTAGLTGAECEALRVTVVPLTLEVDGKLCSDPGTLIRPGLEVLSPGELHARMLAGAAPRTSLGTPEDFARHYEAALMTADRALCLPVTAALSGTFASAAAARAFGDRVRVVDARGVSVALWAAVRQARAWLDAGDTSGRVAGAVEGYGERVFLRFVPQELRWLIAGGRLSRVAGAAAGVLGVRPVLAVEGGRPLVRARVRGFAAGLREVVRAFPEEREAVVLHAGNPGGAALIAGELARRGVTATHTRDISAVLTVHAGPGTAGLAGVPPLARGRVA